MFIYKKRRNKSAPVLRALDYIIAIRRDVVGNVSDSRAIAASRAKLNCLVKVLERLDNVDRVRYVVGKYYKIHFSHLSDLWSVLSFTVPLLYHI